MSDTPISLYRLARGPALTVTGGCIVVAGILAFAGFLLVGDGTIRRVAAFIVGALAVASLLVAARFAWRSPVVVRLDGTGMVVTRPRSRTPWSQVEDVVIEDGHLVLSGGGRAWVDVRLVEPSEQADLLRDVYDRLNAAHGYRRFG
ncbi:MAG: hypothetical protein QM621_13520 [Aeromicrobium sp.]|uniref:hypothetical protein n=1 Tax=Aeromicrobium sp. TaxID=1871063 RepID=UPI0039E2CD0E